MEKRGRFMEHHVRFIRNLVGTHGASLGSLSACDFPLLSIAACRAKEAFRALPRSGEHGGWMIAGGLMWGEHG
jgi:hypothetical protein